MTPRELIRDGLSELAAQLHGRRGSILADWSAAVAADPVLTTAPSLPRRQFLDHIPAMLDAFEEVLRSWGKEGAGAAMRREDVRAAQHGLERWRQGYQLFEVIREWRHLQVTLVVTLEELSQGLDAQAMSVARRLLAELCADGACESAERYFTLQRAEAHSRLTELERALKQFEGVERERAESWREAAHDLRGNLGVVKTATTLLTASGVADVTRARSLGILHRGVESMTELLNELISLARLEAGREVRQLQSFDVSALMAELCRTMAQLAETRGLNLSFEGPAALVVEGDPMKVRRIAQNLLMNALTYTVEGSVVLSCHPMAPDRWTLCVADSGPGFAPDVAFGGGSSLAAGVEAVPVADAELLTPADPHPVTAPISGAMAGLGAGPRGGEGIGLSIVKRLCELLDATVELTSEAGRGSSFLISFPARYDA